MKNKLNPDFFIVGAPKCGTTSLYSYLKQHPEIFMPDRKEPHFFGTDLKWNRMNGLDLDGYNELFTLSKDNSLTGEASVFYLFSDLAPFEIKKYNPKSKIIIALRNPTELIYSLHSQFLYSGNEDIENFETALHLEKQRKLGKNIPPNIDLLEKVFYKSYIYKLPKQIKVYKELFKHNVHIILLDDLKNDIEKTYKYILEFLNVDTFYQPNFEIENANKIPRFIFLRDFMKKYGNTLGKVRKLFFKNSIGIMNKLENINKKEVRRNPIDPILKKKLTNEFLVVVNELEKIINRDLSNWKK